MNIPSNLKYTQNDEWLQVEGDQGVVGITDHAQEQLSDIVFVEIVVAEGDSVKQGDTIATVESVKAAADVYSPVSGTITEINESLPDTPEMINSDPFGKAWLVKLEIGSPTEADGLLTPEAYQERIQES